MRPQGRGPRVVAALCLALALGGLSVQVATADDDTDVPTRGEVREAREAVDAQELDVEGVQAALDAANQRLADASVAAAQAAEAFNGARYEARLARDEAHRAATVAQDAADEADRQQDAYRDAMLSSYTSGSSLGALSSVIESDGLSELVQRSATMRSSEAALDGRYDDLRAAQSDAEDAADDAEQALEVAEDAQERARELRDVARTAADDAAAAAQEIAGEKTQLITRLARLQGISVELAERRRAGLEARAAALAAEQAQDAVEEPPAVEPDPAPQDTPTDPVGPTPTDQPEQPEPTPPSPPSGSPPAPAGGAQAAISFARDQLGEPYQWAAAGPGAWDCSGLTMGAWSAGGKSLPHYSVAQYQQSTPIAADQLQPGDLVFWGSSGSSSSIYHVALYVGNDRIIHAPRTGRPVSEESMYYWIPPTFFARP